jgi:hypothetical protein
MSPLIAPLHLLRNNTPTRRPATRDLEAQLRARFGELIDYFEIDRSTAFTNAERVIALVLRLEKNELPWEEIPFSAQFLIRSRPMESILNFEHSMEYRSNTEAGYQRFFWLHAALFVSDLKASKQQPAKQG